MLPWGRLLKSVRGPVSKIVAGEKGLKNLDPSDYSDVWNGADSMMRGELDDGWATIKRSMADLTPADSNSVRKYSLGGVLDHSDLYKAYPELKNGELTFFHNPDTAYSGSFIPGKIPTMEVNMAKVNDADHLKSILLHEIQHNIQENEGFADYALGTSPKKAGGYFPYMKNLGETEARVVEQRKNWTPQQRVNAPFPDHLEAEQRRLDFLREQAEKKGLSGSPWKSSLYWDYKDKLEDPSIMAMYLRRYNTQGPKKQFQRIDPITLNPVQP
jgi:hypothetical protein